MKTQLTALAAAITLVWSAASHAQVEWGQEYGNRIKSRQTISALGPDLFGEQVNLFDGTTSFSATDIDLPGNNALPVAVKRKLAVGSTSNAGQQALFGDWDLDLPYLSNISTTSSGWNAPADPNFYWRVVGGSAARCSAPQQAGDVVTPDIANSLNGAAGGGGEMLLLTASTSSKLVRPTLPGTRWVTKGLWYLGCVPTLASGHAGEGFWAVDPQGNKYTFDWMVPFTYPGFSTPAIKAGSEIVQNRSELRLYPTKVEDRFGNWVKYRWQGRKLLDITASDGRRIDLTYGADDQIVSATAHGKTWNYAYVDYPQANVGGHLTGVTLPDGSAWSYGQNPGPYVAYEQHYETRYSSTPGGSPMQIQVEVLEKVAFCSYDHYLSPAVVPFEMRHPSGARGVFNFKTMRHGRTNTPGECAFSWDTHDTSNREAQNNHNLYPAFKDVWSLTGKTLSGPGMPDGTWTYAYDNLQACIDRTCANSGTPVTKTVTVTEPDGSSTVSTFGKNYGIDEGQLLAVETRQGATVLSRTSYSYVSNTEAPNQPFPDLVGVTATEYGDPWASTALRPQKATSTVRGGVTFSSVIDSFDAFAHPTRTTRGNSQGNARTDVIDYFHDLGRWVIGQVARTTNVDTGMVESETGYTALAQPQWTKKFGKLQQTLAYNPDGTLASVTDGRGNVTSLSNWKRGIPGTIGYPATAEAPTGSSKSATVNDLGWITALTDETGSKTCYGYDNVGRINLVTYPSASTPGICDASRWNPTVMDLQFVASAEHGIAGGHWRASNHTGSGYSTLYYDALLRPVLEEKYDAGDVAGSLSQVVKRYDSKGQLLFTSYPTRDVGDIATVTQGTRTVYDALGRPTRSEQDSELGVLATVTEYTTGLETRITNPRGAATTTRFLAWDTPNFDLPVQSLQPEGKVVEVARHPRFGWPLAMTQRAADNSVSQQRRYVYDGNAQLCKTIEPETGVTVTGYDAANNPAWMAAGLSGSDASFNSTTDCSYAAAYGSGRRVDRSFDARNRLLTLAFPDGRGDQSWTYEKDGLSNAITTWNGAGRTQPVVNSYAYDVRRLLQTESIAQTGWYTWSVGHSYDANGFERWLSYPTGLVLDFAPNALGQVTQVRDQNNVAYASNASYHPNGTLKQFTYGNGIVHTMTQNARQLPARVRDGAAMDYEYSYDANGNFASIWDHARDSGNGMFGRWMTYDNLDRLTSTGSCTFGGDCWHRYSYDALDNLRSWTLTGVKDYSNYVYDANNRLTAIRNTAGTTLVSLGYDAQGNLSSKNGQAFSFDFGNRLRGALGSETYRYDGRGRRVQQSKPGSDALSFYSSAGQILFSYDKSGGEKTHENIYLNGSVIAEVDHDWPSNAVLAVKYQHTDALGSPVAVTGSNGQLIERNDYEPYGAVIGKPAFTGIGYTGHVMDGGTGLTYMQQRYYDASIGRFLSVDPVVADPAKASGFSRYWYANGNPYRYTDPDGREVVIHISRDTYSDSTVTSRITVTSDRTDEHFEGYTLETQHAGQNGDKKPLQEGTYSGKVRTDGPKGFRIELQNTPKFRNIQIHSGNTKKDVKGCFAAGTTRSGDSVGNSRSAMSQIQQVVNADGTGKIRVVVDGPSDPPKPNVDESRKPKSQ